MPGEEPFMVSTFRRAREGGSVRLGGLFPKGKLSRISTNSRAREGQGGGGSLWEGGGRSLWGGPLPKENDPIFKTVGKNSTN